jgi:hypothetical protein
LDQPSRQRKNSRQVEYKDIAGIKTPLQKRQKLRPDIAIIKPRRQTAVEGSAIATPRTTSAVWLYDTAGAWIEFKLSGLP